MLVDGRRNGLSAVERHRKLQYFQTMNHSKVIWGRGAKPKGILGGHINIRSELPKHEQIEHLLNDSNLDFLCLSETWLTKTSPGAALIMHGYKCFSHDRKTGRGGGLLIYVKDHFKCEQVHLECSKDFECIAVLITLSLQMSFTIVVVYRPHLIVLTFKKSF